MVMRQVICYNYLDGHDFWESSQKFSHTMFHLIGLESQTQWTVFLSLSQNKLQQRWMIAVGNKVLVLKWDLETNVDKIYQIQYGVNYSKLNELLTFQTQMISKLYQINPIQNILKPNCHISTKPSEGKQLQTKLCGLVIQIKNI